MILARSLTMQMDILVDTDETDLNGKRPSETLQGTQYSNLWREAGNHR